MVGSKDEPRTLDVRSQLCDASHYRVTFPFRREVVPHGGFEQGAPAANGLPDVVILLLEQHKFKLVRQPVCVEHALLARAG